MKLFLLRAVLLLDAATLLLLGTLLMFAPGRVQETFHFRELPPAVGYLLGLWGCGLVGMGVGYLVAAAHPIKHRVWVQIGILRGVAECILGLCYLVRGTVTFPQAGFGIVLAAGISVAYFALYPRPPRLVSPVPPPTPAPTPA